MPARIGPRLCRFVLVFARLWLHEDGMHRRRFIASLGAIALPRVAAAQQKTMPVVGYLNGTNPEANAVQLAAFRQGLSETGWVEGQNLNISGADEAFVAKDATWTIPTVFMTGADRRDRARGPIARRPLIPLRMKSAALLTSS